MIVDSLARTSGMNNIAALRAARDEAETDMVDLVPADGPDYDDPAFQAASAAYKAACLALAAAEESRKAA